VPRYRYDQLMRLGWKIFLPLSLLFVVLTSGWLMLTRYSNADPYASAQPSRSTLALLGASDACVLKAPKDYSNENAHGMIVYLYRPPSDRSDANVFEIKYPAELAGKVRYAMERTNGFGGSGALRWIDTTHPAKLGWGQTDVYQDGRAGGILFYENGNDVKMGDCRTAPELQS
jgi:hypothetical protein